MYHPYFRGKQFELITIRETAGLMAKARFTPIIEPVKEALNGLDRALTAICEASGTAILIVNPGHGEHSDNGDGITDFLNESFVDGNIQAGILLKNDMSVDDAVKLFDLHQTHQPVFIHSGFSDPKGLANKLESSSIFTDHVFEEKACGKLYRRHFNDRKRILLRDGFVRRRNADHPPSEPFSDLHLTYEEEGMNGFGDYLIVGDEYSEGGGPAYAVAIHLTYIDPKQDEMMYIYHFLSTSNNTPTDPAGKFGQALDSLIAKLDSGTSMLFEGEAIQEFRELHAKQHFPGLGYVKKLSMKHHIETLADFLG